MSSQILPYSAWFSIHSDSALFFALKDCSVCLLKLWEEFHNLWNKIHARNTYKDGNNENGKILIKIIILLSKTAWTAGRFPCCAGCNRVHPCRHIVWSHLQVEFHYWYLLWEATNLDITYSFLFLAVSSHVASVFWIHVIVLFQHIFQIVYLHVHYILTFNCCNWNINREYKW